MRIQEICKLNKNYEFYFVSNLYLKETKQKSEQESLQWCFMQQSYVLY